MTKDCARCGETKTPDSFHKHKTGPMGLHSWCKACVNARQRETRARRDTPERKRQWNLRARYGLSPEDVARMRERQGGVCAICKRVPKREVIDHCHTSGRVRGILCDTCNLNLPAIEDEAYRLAALAYLAGE